MTAAGAKPQIAHCREILFWPFFFEDSSEMYFDQIIRSGGWQPETDWLQRQYHYRSSEGKRAALTAYGEFVYFQPYVQRFLYQSKVMKVWRRDDVVQLQVTLTELAAGKRQQTPTINCSVEQLWLFRFTLGDMQLGMLALELRVEQSQPLSVIQNFLDQMRRVYPPYWESGVAKRFPWQVTFVQADGEERVFNSEPMSTALAAFNVQRTLPLSRHWRWLLDRESTPQLEQALRHIEDERAQTMTFIAVENPRDLTRGDFVRLCFADDSGDSANLPYSEAILADFENRYCYDRFWVADAREQPGSNWMKTRILNCGYAFTLCGDVNEAAFFMNAESGGLSHFRNHYFMIALIIHFQRAALLLFSDRLSYAVDTTENKLLRERAKTTLHQFIDFTDRYWFEDISTQLQPQELYQQWRGHLKLAPLYQQVKEEAQLLTGYLDTHAVEQQNQAVQQEARYVNQLTWVAATWGIISLLPDYGLGRWFTSANISVGYSLIILLGLLAVFGGFAYWLHCRIQRKTTGWDTSRESPAVLKKRT